MAVEGEETTEEESLDIHLKRFSLQNLDIHKFNEANGLDVETYIYEAIGGLKTTQDHISMNIDSKFELNIIDHQDTTFINHKHFELHTDLTFQKETGVLFFDPSVISMEHGDFELEGMIDTENEMEVDIKIKGAKPNFDMLIAFAPANIIPLLEEYDNEGKIFFNAEVKGPTANGKMPFIDAVFGAHEAFLENKFKHRRVENMGFDGHFTNGEKKSLQTMEFSLNNMEAKMEKGNFIGSIFVKNFEEPEIDMNMNADFNLAFLTEFLNLKDIKDVTGHVFLDMRFHDVIDLNNPEEALSDLNQAYYCEAKIEGLALQSSTLPAPLKSLDMHLTMNGKEAQLDLFDLKLGESQVLISGYLSDLPAIVHHTDIPVVAHLEISSDIIDVAELTEYSLKDSIGIDEQMEDFSVGFSFKSSARAFTESEYLPKGEFFIDSLHAQLKHYPHELHDFHADVLIDDKDLKLLDFTGYIDDSDFHFNGWVHDYSFWMKEKLEGDVDFDFTLTSDSLRLEDVFSYNGENYVPEDYRHEEFDALSLHVNSNMHYQDSELKSIDIDLDKLDTKMLLHPMRFHDFNGHFHYEDEHLLITKLHGEIGKTNFNMMMDYYLGEDLSIRKRDNKLKLKANYIDYDQLFAFNLAAPDEVDTPIVNDSINEHEVAFNLYELPFTNMEIEVDIDHLKYHDLDIQNIKAELRTTPNHYLYVDTLDMHVADGDFRMNGYFNGSDPAHIYLKPNLVVEHADIDKMLFHFESFGNDVSLSENLHGLISTSITGKIHVYPDLVPDIESSEIHLDLEVTDGRLVNYEPMLLLSDYMGDKDLTNIRFDTLVNHMDITNGFLTVPNMRLETTLGHFEMSGQMDTKENIEYYVRIPWETIKSGAKSKLFNGADDVKKANQNEIIEFDPNKKQRYLNLKIQGTMDDYGVTLGKSNASF